MVLITFKTILNEKAGYHFCRWSRYFGYDKNWLHIRNIKYRSNYEYFYQKLSWPPEKWQTTPRLKTTALSKVATQLRLNARWCISEACKHGTRNRNRGHDGFLFNCNIGCKQHTGNRATFHRDFHKHLHRKGFTSEWWHWSKVEAWNFTIRTFLNLSIQWKKSFHLPA